MRKKLAMWSLLCFLMLASLPVTAQAAWKSTSAGMMYTTTDGYYKGWQTIDGAKYYFSSKGIMQTGWVKISDAYYYFGTDEKMRTGWQTIDKKVYYFGSNGQRRTGWRTIKSRKTSYKYYFNSRKN